MKKNQRLCGWWTLPIFVLAIGWSGHAHAAVVSSIQSGDWENTATWSCGCVPGPTDTITISNGTTVKVNSTRHAGSVTVNGTLDTNDQFFEIEGTAFTNNGSVISSTGSFGEIDFNGVGAVAGTTQTIAGMGTYAGGASFPVDFYIINGTTVTPSSGTVINGVRNLSLQAGTTLSLSNTFVFSNGTITSFGGGTISGAGLLKTQGLVTLNFGGSTTVSLEVASGTTTGVGNFAQLTIDNGATLFQGSNLVSVGNVAVNGTLDTNDQFFEFEGTTFTNNGSIISATGSFGEIDFNGVGAAAGTTQTIAGAGTYAGGASFPVEIHIINGTTVTASSGTVVNGVSNLSLQAGTTLSLSNTFVFGHGTITSFSGGTISGVGPLQTHGPATLTLAGSTSAPLQAIDGTTTASGNFGPVTINNGATLLQSSTLTANGNVTVNGILDTNDQFFEFKGTTFTNGGSVVSNAAPGQIDFDGVGGAAGTTQNVAGTGPYNLIGRTDIRLLNTVTVAITGAAGLNGIGFCTIDSGCTLDFSGSGGLTLAGNVSNSGTVKLNGGGAACGDTTKILLRSSVMGVQRDWGGGGIFLMTDVDVQDQTGSAAITVTGGVNSGNNGANWIFATCGLPTPTPTPTATPSKLVNISTRMRVQTGDKVLIGGFIIVGSEPKRVIVRALGPSLGATGVPGTLADPILELHEPGDVVITNDNWRSDQEAEIIATTIPPSNDLESAIVATLNPGTYTAVVRGNNGGTGVGLVEAYDLNEPANSRLANISTRGFVETVDNVMIGGLIIGPADGAGARIIVRAIGPSLTASGVPNALQDPILELHDANGGVTTNDNWRQTQESEIQATGLAPTDDHESAILATLAPGNYTAVVRGVNDTTGNGLVEFYHLP